jgi:hypothetical protein
MQIRNIIVCSVFGPQHMRVFVFLQMTLVSLTFLARILLTLIASRPYRIKGFSVSLNGSELSHQRHTKQTTPRYHGVSFERR